tara:strand:+ start:296 stop:742 length:447 start_codon:yes stop_codon:yes gene_type:complete
MTSSGLKTSTKLILILIGAGALLIGGFVFFRCRSDISGLSYCSRFGFAPNPTYPTPAQVLLYKEKLDGNAFSEVTIVEGSRIGFRKFLVADEMRFNRSKLRWEFISGKIITLTPGGTLTSMDFDRYLYPLLEDLHSEDTSMTIIKSGQ